ncbi:formylglycine-generating enzyme family protein [Litoreibacter arenae]|nr:formylglycine-generating enzyme family protein [Litoreibacter arenae]
MSFIKIISRVRTEFIGQVLRYAIALMLIVGTSAATAKEPLILSDDLVVAPLDAFQECDVCPEMIVLPMGSFVMGAPLEQSEAIYLLWNKPKPGEPLGMLTEGPEHKVIIDIPIAMGRNEVTREEWLACVAENGCSHLPDPRILKFGGGYYYADDPRHPVFDVSYFDMLEYITWLNRKAGADVYRLPTEAEWEYAARAGTNSKFAQGDSLTTDQANVGVFRRIDGRSKADPDNRKTPVIVDELDAANAWGLRHLAGNLRERTMSCWSERHLGLSKSSDYLAAANEVDNCRRVAKGGTYQSSAEYARPANRGAGSETYRSRRTGFRIVREMLKE